MKENFITDNLIYSCEFRAKDTDSLPIFQQKKIFSAIRRLKFHLHYQAITIY